MSRKPARNAVAAHNGSSQLRIIGGQWRSRRLSFTQAPGLRPTPDRVRETLYNWLAPYIEGANLLDCFAGSGALFLEGLSRGAESALALELNPQSANTLKQHLSTLNCTAGQVELTDSLKYLAQAAQQRFDIALLDPPFHQDLLKNACHFLEDNGWLSEDAWIYTESEQAPSRLELPTNWRLHREKHTGQVFYSLWQRS